MNEEIYQALANRKTAQELVTDGIRMEILNGTLKDGEPIDLKELETRFEVSRMPIRIALQQLEGEGLVLQKAHRKPVASKLSADQVRKLSEVRLELEALAIRNAIPHLTDEDFDRMEAILIEMDTANVEQFLKLNLNFHDVIYQASKNEFLRNMINQIRNNVERYLKMFLKDESHIRSANKEHYQLFHALKEKKIEKAQQIGKRHLKSSSDAIVNVLEERG